MGSSFIVDMRTRPEPASSPGVTTGRSIEKKRLILLAPSTCDASSRLSGIEDTAARAGARA